MTPLILALSLATQSASNFCEKHLIAHEPGQYRDATVDQLVGVYWMFKNQGHRSEPLLGEIWERLEGDDLSDEDREILVKTLGNEE